MKRTPLLLIAPLALLVTVAPTPADAGGYLGFGISNHGVSLGFGGSNWGIWGSSWGAGSVSVGFSATLAGYGEWVSVGGLGRVWRPWVAAGWRPFHHGRWVWTSLGWTWVAYEPWGWVPHHYGNWAFSTVGWVWVPGYSYHPGNVVWMSTGAHVGWVPCAPRGWSHFNRGFHHGWHSGYASGRHAEYSRGYTDGWRDARYATWVPWSGVATDNVAHHAVGHEVATRTVARSRVVAMPAPPSKIDVERRGGRPVPQARAVERKATVDGREIRVVRPEGQVGSVRRHGGATVDRALSPTAKNRAARADARTTRSDGVSEPRGGRRNVASSDPKEVRRSVEPRRAPTYGGSKQRSVSGGETGRDRETRRSTISTKTSRSPSSRARPAARAQASRPSVSTSRPSSEVPRRSRAVSVTDSRKARADDRSTNQPERRTLRQPKDERRTTTVEKKRARPKEKPEAAARGEKRNRRSRPNR